MTQILQVAHDSAQYTEVSAASLPSQAPQEYFSHDSALSATANNSAPEADDPDVDDRDDDDNGHDFDDDNDSAFGGSLIGCDTDTLASFITDYRYENGRRYHAYRDGEYWVL